MDKKLKLASNERLDLPDATAIHDLVDATFRAVGRIAGEPGPGLTDTLGTYDPPGVVVSGWTVRVNPSDDQQVLITPGTAYCKQLVDGVPTYGQLTAPSATELTYTLSAPLQAYGLWVRFDYAAADTDNRAFWNLASSPPSETIQPVTTRVQALALISKSSTSAAPDANGWFKIADVDYSAGFIVAADIVDRRALLVEGQASGTANPATTWEIPDFSRSNSRGTIGGRSFFGAIMRIFRRLIEVSGRDQWYAPPTYGENIRSASSMLTGGGSTEVPHVTLSATPTTTELGEFLSGDNQPDQRNGVALIPGQTGLNASYSVDCTSGSITLAASKRMVVRGSANIARTAGTLPLVVTGGFDAIISGVGFTESTAIGDPVVSLASASDDLTFQGCTFTAGSATQGVLVDIAAAGRYIFQNCTFTGNGVSTTSLVRVNASGVATFINCTFSGGLFALNVPDAGKGSTVSIVGGSFSGAGTVFRDEAGTCNLSWQGIAVSGTVTADAAITGTTPFAANTLNKSSRGYDKSIARSLWAQTNEIRMGNDAVPATITTTAAAAGQLTGTKAAAAGMLDAVFNYFYADGGAVVFGNNGSSAVDSRLQKVGAALALLDGASTDVATSNYLAALALHFGALSVPRGRMGAQQVPIGWGEINYSSGEAPTAFEALWHDKDGTTNLQATGLAVLNFEGTGNYHRWTVASIPPTQAVSATGNLNNYVVVADLTSNVVGAGGFGRNASGTLTYRGSVMTTLSSTSNVELVPVLVDDAGDQVGFRSVDPGGADYTFTPAAITAYTIKWVVFTNPALVV